MKSLKIEELPEDLRKTDGAYIDDIFPVNWNPHPYTIGPRHVSYASDHYGGILGDEVLRHVPCAYSEQDRNRRVSGNCNLPYEEHTYDVVAFVRLTRDIEGKELQTWLLAVKDAIPADRRLDGFAFAGKDARVSTIAGWTDSHSWGKSTRYYRRQIEENTTA